MISIYWIPIQMALYIQGESKKPDTFDIQMNNKGVSFFWLTLYTYLCKLRYSSGAGWRLYKTLNHFLNHYFVVK
jgi:hypothetical protein